MGLLPLIIIALFGMAYVIFSPIPEYSFQARDIYFDALARKQIVCLGCASLGILTFFLWYIFLALNDREL